MKTKTRRYRWCRAAGSLILLALLARVGSAAENTVHGRITYEAQEGIYVNVGTDGGLTQGLTGTLQFEDGRTVQFEVLHAARQSALLRLPGYPWAQRVLDHAVQLAFEPRSAAQTAPGPASETKSQKEPPKASPAPGAAASGGRWTGVRRGTNSLVSEALGAELAVGGSV